ncbi:MAG: HXXEE domain-containing protein [Deltaproteobacteria bacterium]|nr:HXXEE domain-containing protein [Deltaproteobacteria bacterium]
MTDQIQWLFPIALTFHNLEEWIWLPGWSRKAGKFHGAVGEFEFRFAVTVLTVAAYVITALSISDHEGSVSDYLFAGYCAAMLINVIMPHLVATLVMRSYAPGLITGALFIAPVTICLLWRLLSTGTVTAVPLIIWSGGFIVMIVGIIPVLFALGRKLRSMGGGKYSISRMVLFLLCIYLAFFLFSWGFGGIDYERLRQGRAPLFAVKTAQYKDGGSIRYSGLFYTLVEWDQLPGGIRGVELTYVGGLLCPLIGSLRADRSDTVKVDG